MSAAIILFEASPRNASSGAEVSVRLAGGGAERAHRYFSDNFMPGILTLPAREARLGLAGTARAGARGLCRSNLSCNLRRMKARLPVLHRSIGLMRCLR